jgi:hypothetical protein
MAALKSFDQRIRMGFQAESLDTEKRKSRAQQIDCGSDILVIVGVAYDKNILVFVCRVISTRQV